MNRLLIIYTVCFIGFISCSKKNKITQDFYDKNVETFVLQGVDIKTNDPDLAIIKIIGLHDSIMYMESLARDTLINVYRLRNDSLIRSHRFLNRGQGPYEIGVFGSLYDKKSKTLSFFENERAFTKGYVIDLNSKNGTQNKESWKQLDFSGIKEYRFGHDFTYISDSLLLAIGGKYNNKEILSVIHLNNNKGEATSLDLWPDDGYEDNPFVKQSIYMDNALILKNSFLNKYLYVSMMGKYMEIFQIKDNQIVNRQAICEIYPEYEAEEDGLNYKTEKETDRGFYVYTTDSLIYARPIEFSMEELRTGGNYKGYGLGFNENVHVFDWNGNPIKKFELDTPFHSFIVDDKDSIMYTLTTDLNTDESLVKKYLLK
ncbi:MAG: TolB-like 6-bladed beta-propeller domain-containing protein [Prevotella sp.]|jgi:hypothetical protein|nr:TolB-like 6-bladed beta-propeller domain-containing protein [Prevotella sp.]